MKVRIDLGLIPTGNLQFAGAYQDALRVDRLRGPLHLLSIKQVR